MENLNKQRKRMYVFTIEHLRAFNMLRCTVSLQEKERTFGFLDTAYIGWSRRVKNLECLKCKLAAHRLCEG